MRQFGIVLFTAAFQSARPCGARLCARHGAVHRFAISIRAPVWGATHHLLGCVCALYHFNPRARVGRDAEMERLQKEMMISIRAPVWGAT